MQNGINGSGGSGKKCAALAYITRAGIIGALYAALTILLYPISFGSFQIRISEAMAVLPVFFPEAISGLFIGCAAANLLTPNFAMLDVVFGSLATLLAAFITSKLKKKWLAPLPPVLINAVVIGAVITVSTVKEGDSFSALLLLNMLLVGAGQAVACYGLGIPLMIVVEKISDKINKKNNFEELQ